MHYTKVYIARIPAVKDRYKLYRSEKILISRQTAVAVADSHKQ